MGMRCVKTGAQAYIAQYSTYVICDAFEDQGLLILRIAGESREPGRLRTHFVVHEVDNWWRDEPYGTLVSSRFSYFGYEGTERTFAPGDGIED